MRKADQELAVAALDKAIAALEDAQTHLAGDPAKVWHERYRTVILATSKAKWVRGGIERHLKRQDDTLAKEGHGHS